MSESVWTWYYNYLEDLYDSGQETLYHKIDMLSTYAYEKDQKSVEAIYPELIAHARGQKNKWLEIFVRHWRLQAYVNTNHDPRKLVPEVLDLLAFTNAEDTKNCPQSTCVIDDITDIYAAIDATGFAQERHDMLVETLDGLSVQIECFQCITMSLVDALVDLNEPEEALAVFDKSSQKAPHLYVESHFYRYLAPMVGEAMIEAGRYEQAADILEKCQPPHPENLSEVNCLKLRLANARQKTARPTGLAQRQKRLPHSPTSLERRTTTHDEREDYVVHSRHLQSKGSGSLAESSRLEQ